MFTLSFQRTRDVKMPTQDMRNCDAGIDCYTPKTFNEGLPLVLQPQKDINIDLGLCVDIPRGFALIGFNKSGVSTKQKLQVGACVIDCSYKREIHAHMFNYSDQPITIYPDKKIVQFVMLRIHTPWIKEVEFIEDDTNRGGFGSTGL